MGLIKDEQAIIARRKYQKQWRSRHKDRVKEYNRRYWERVAERSKGKVKPFDNSS